MKKYVCSICGYVYDEAKEGVKFDDLPSDWVCPLCKAPKSMFSEQKLKPEVKATSQVSKKVENASSKDNSKDKRLSNAELNVLCTNLAKGCEKQYLAEEAELFNEIAEYYKANSEKSKENSFDDIQKILNVDIVDDYPNAFSLAKEDSDRGALRILTWSEKVSKTLSSIIARYKKDGSSFLENAKIFVCEICGFIYIGDEAPEICPICKVPRLKIHEVGRV